MRVSSRFYETRGKNVWKELKAEDALASANAATANPAAQQEQKPLIPQGLNDGACKRVKFPTLYFLSMESRQLYANAQGD